MYGFVVRVEHRDATSSGTIDDCSRIFVALWERTHYLLESSVLMGLHPAVNPTRSADELTLLWTTWNE